jgi:hypothetical protein
VTRRHLPPGELSTLAAPCDTGLMIEGRAAREHRLRAQRQRRQALSLVLVIAALALGGWLIARNVPVDSRTSGASGTTQGATFARAMDAPEPEPTPLFAAYRDVALRLPVAADKLTEIAFHQASYTYATHLTTKLPTASTDAASKKRGTGRAVATTTVDAQGWLAGSVLRLWRARPGEPDSAADVGAPAGTPVLAPVTGDVMLVRAYKLYGKYPDFQVHIRPEGHDDLDLVLIHVTDPKVKAGDEVVGGVTQVGAVRNLSSHMRLQLSDYTKGPGDHTHVQLNRVKPGTTEPVTKS